MALRGLVVPQRLQLVCQQAEGIVLQRVGCGRELSVRRSSFLRFARPPPPLGCHNRSCSSAVRASSAADYF